MKNTHEIGGVTAIGDLEFNVEAEKDPLTTCRGCYFNAGKYVCGHPKAALGLSVVGCVEGHYIFTLREQSKCHERCVKLSLSGSGRCARFCIDNPDNKDLFEPKPKFCHLDPSKTFPAPYRGEMKVGQRFWVVGQSKVSIQAWASVDMDRQWRDLGLIHLTEEAATQHWNARQAIVGEG